MNDAIKIANVPFWNVKTQDSRRLLEKNETIFCSNAFDSECHIFVFEDGRIWNLTEIAILANKENAQKIKEITRAYHDSFRYFRKEFQNYVLWQLETPAMKSDGNKCVFLYAYDKKLKDFQIRQAFFSKEDFVFRLDHNDKVIFYGLSNKRDIFAIICGEDEKCEMVYSEKLDEDARLTHKNFCESENCLKLVLETLKETNNRRTLEWRKINLNGKAEKRNIVFRKAIVSESKSKQFDKFYFLVHLPNGNLTYGSDDWENWKTLKFDGEILNYYCDGEFIIATISLEAQKFLFLDLKNDKVYAIIDDKEWKLDFRTYDLFNPKEKRFVRAIFMPNKLNWSYVYDVNKGKFAFGDNIVIDGFEKRFPNEAIEDFEKKYQNELIPKTRFVAKVWNKNKMIEEIKTDAIFAKNNCKKCFLGYDFSKEEFELIEIKNAFEDEKTTQENELILVSETYKTEEKTNDGGKEVSFEEKFNLSIDGDQITYENLKTNRKEKISFESKTSLLRLFDEIEDFVKIDDFSSLSKKTVYRKKSKSTFPFISVIDDDEKTFAIRYDEEEIERELRQIGKLNSKVMIFPSVFVLDRFVALDCRDAKNLICRWLYDAKTNKIAKINGMTLNLETCSKILNVGNKVLMASLNIKDIYMIFSDGTIIDARNYNVKTAMENVLMEILD